MKKTALFVFNGDPMCFIHVLLNALDMKERGEIPQIVIEGAATKLIPDLDKETHPLHGLWEKTKSAKLIAGACKACANKMGTLEAAQAQHISLLDQMSGHPSMAWYRDEGFDIITF